MKQQYLVNGLLALLTIAVLSCGAMLAQQWISTAPEHDLEQLCTKAAHYLNTGKLNFAASEKRADYLAVQALDENGVAQLCIFERSPLFPERWEAT